jgi:hypothetical protein
MQQQHKIKIRQQLAAQDCWQKKNRRHWPQQASAQPLPHRHHMSLKGNYPIPQIYQQGTQTQFHN